MALAHGLQLRSGYWADAPARAAFKRCIREVFDIDLEPWDASGYWDDDYRPFSLFAEDGRVVASVCLYSMHMVVAGRPVRVAQVSGVSVLPEFRRRGLARELTDTALRWAAEHGHNFFMLFASEQALPLYRSCGFQFTPEHTPVLRLDDPHGAAPAEPPGDIQLLDMTQSADRSLLFWLACHRCPVSRELGVLNERLLMYHAMLTSRGRVHYIPSLNVAVFFRHKEETLMVYDVVGPRVPPFSQLLPFLRAPEDREVLFWFNTDQMGNLGKLGTLEHRPLTGNNLHLQTGFPFASPAVMPFTAQA